MIFGHNVLDIIQPASNDASSLWMLFHVPGFLSIGEEFGVFVAYPLIPWIGVMAIGYVIGPFFVATDPTRPKRLIQAGLVMMVAFVVLRFLSLYGEPNIWHEHETFAATMVDFLHTTKYPPSLQFLLMTIGPAVMLLGIFEKRSGRWIEPLVTIGRVPFLFYVVHLYLIHTIALGVGLAQGFSISQIAVVPARLPEGFGMTLGAAYLFWIGAVLALYPMCRWFAQVKKRRRDWWLSYL